jgi:hypothetical protein
MSSGAWGEKEEAGISSFRVERDKGNVHLALSWKLDRFVEHGHSQQRSGLDWHYVLLGLLISFVQLYLALSPSPLRRWSQDSHSGS